MFEARYRDWKDILRIDAETQHKSPILARAMIEYRPCDCPDLAYMDTIIIDGRVKSLKYTQEMYDKNGHEWVVAGMKEDQEEKNSYNINWSFLNVFGLAFVAIPGREPEAFHITPIKTQGTPNLSTTTLAEAQNGDSHAASLIDAIEYKELEELRHILSHMNVRGMDIMGGHLRLVEGDDCLD